MTLLPALQAFLEGLGITGPFPLGEVVDGSLRAYTLLQIVGTDGEDKTRTHSFPVVQIFFSRLTQESAHADAWAAYRALNTMSRLTLDTGYTVARSRCPAIPVPLGRDGVGAKQSWRYSLDVNFSLPYSAAI